jgi:hypothetical protein
MPRFIATHKPIYSYDQFETLIDSACNLIRSLDSQTKWMNFWWGAEDEIMFCEWEAENLDVLHQILAKTNNIWTTEKIYPVVWANPGWTCNENSA